MARTFDENERIKLINAVGKYYLYCDGIPSCRKCVEYLKKGGNSISTATVKDYLDRFMKMNPATAPIIYDIICGNKPKTIDDESVKNRVIIVSNMIVRVFNIDDIVFKNGYTINIVYDDYYT